jgi:transglutaminase-like putative cysteine protease
MLEVQSSENEDYSLPGKTLNWLVVAMALALLPHLKHLPWWLGIFFAVVVSWRWQATGSQASLSRGWLFLITLGTLGTILQGYHTLFGRDAGVALLAAMVALKFLELRALRDSMILIFLGYFLTMANLLYSQSLPMVAYLLAVLVILLAAQVMVQRQHSAFPPVALLLLCTRMLIQSLPIMIILFVLFPRVSGPLWGLPKDAHGGLTGLSDTMTPGSISKLSLSNKVAFRVRFDGSVPPPGQLYWRGPVLWQFDGHSWTRGEETLHTTFDYKVTGKGVDYVVILEPHGERWLYALDLPAHVPTEAVVTDSLLLLRGKPVDEVLRYQMRSYPNYRIAELANIDRLRALQLPANGNPRAHALALSWLKRDSRPEAIVHAVLKLFREQPFHYTLQPPLLGSDDKIDEFLFLTRRGFCEHYAASFVFLMRAAGIPARVVSGYQGGEINALGGYLIVRQSDAHAWAEVELKGQGWVRIDPTAAVAPERVEQGLHAAVTDLSALSFLIRRDYSWLHQLALGWDSLNTAWNEWVLAYGPERQRNFLTKLGFGAIDWRGISVAMVITVTSLSLVMAGLHKLHRRVAEDPVARAYQQFCAKLARRGLERRIHEGPMEFAERVATERPELAARARLIARLYARLRYGYPDQGELLQRLRLLVKDFKA